MKNQINLNITTPCNQNYNQFTPTLKGGFCNACTKEVIDFTEMTTEDIGLYFNTKQTTNVCGRFKNAQLTTLSVKAKKSKLSFISAIGLACLALFSLTTAKAQDNLSRVKTSKIKINQNKANITVKGTVYDNDGLPLPTANVVLQGTTVGVTTDFDGQFIFPEKLKEGDILVFSYVGYDS
ncbi:MAG: carboxypeptidase-like regulatory domain-containing protein, partial [Olleya sp.]